MIESTRYPAPAQRPAPDSPNAEAGREVRLIRFGEALLPGEYVLHSQFDRVTNLVGPNNRLASVVGESVGPGPINVVLAGNGPWPWEALRFDLDAFELVDPEGKSIRLEAPPTLRADSLVSAHGFRSEALAVNLPLCERVLAALAPAESLAFLLDRGPVVPLRRAFDRAFAQRARGAARLLWDWDPVGSVRQLKGCGYGLTPSGDDFACGVVAALDILDRAAGVPIGGLVVSACVAAIGENILSNSFINLASRGYLAGTHKRWVEALVGGTPAEVEAATAKLMEVGETSGADFAAGFLLTCLAAGRRQLASIG